MSLLSANLAQLKLFRGFCGWGMFFNFITGLKLSGLFGGAPGGGGGIPGALGGGGAPGGGGGGGGPAPLDGGGGGGGGGPMLGGVGVPD